jgi:putative toxin-antitoxin system antitoxin component (TIGR02293 family)
MSTTLAKSKLKKAHRVGKAIALREKTKFGVVDFYVYGPGEGPVGQSKPQTLTAAQIIQSIHEGLPVRDLAVLQTQLDMPMERLAPKLGISRATLNRRLAKGKLEPEESDRVVRFARLLGKAIEVFETAEKARLWLNSAQIGLGGVVPLDYAQTEVGAREVEDLLGRIEYSVYS